MSTRTAVPRNDIDRYISRLDDALRGPRRVKRSLLAEARDGLTDAADAYRRAGLEPVEARQRAIADFGAVDEVAPSYRAEIGAAQSRRTALGIVAVLGVQAAVWDRPWPLLSDGPAAPPSGSPAELADTAVEWAGGISMLLAIALVIGARFGARRPYAAAAMGRATGMLACAVGGFLVLSSVLLTTLNPGAWQGPVAAVVVAITLFVLLPVGCLVRSARRSLAFNR